MTPKIPIAAITDEFSPDFETALAPMREIGMHAAELRVVFGKNIMDLTEDELTLLQIIAKKNDIRIISIASPLLKCVYPGGGPIDSRFQHDIFASKHTFEDQPRLTDRAFALAKRLGANIVRVFSYWRTVEPELCFGAVCEALNGLAEKASSHGLTIGLENEHACNIGTAAETARVLEKVKHPNLKVVWDPANAFVGGEIPYPDGYNRIPFDRIVHVHAKDCSMDGHKPEWGPLGTRHVDWKGQIAALIRDGYKGYISLETHWPGPGGDKLEGSRICGWNLKGLASV